MKEILLILSGLITMFLFVYLLGRTFFKAGLHEIDNFLNKKFINSINHKKEEENGKKKE